MPKQHRLVVVGVRPVSDQLSWLELAAPELSAAAQAGHFLMLRCRPEGAADPLLRRACFLASADRAAGRIALLLPTAEPGTRFLAGLAAGTVVDALGLFGKPFLLDSRTSSLLLVGAGPGLAPLLLLARDAARRGAAVTLLAAAAEGLLPPPFLLPPEVEYRSLNGPATGVLDLLVAEGNVPPLLWADQLVAALPLSLVTPLADAVRGARYRWEAGFAQVLVERQIACGYGACGSCAIETRKGWRLACSDGPAFDLRALLGA